MQVAWQTVASGDTLAEALSLPLHPACIFVFCISVSLHVCMCLCSLHPPGDVKFTRACRMSPLRGRMFGNIHSPIQVHAGWALCGKCSSSNMREGGINGPSHRMACGLRLRERCCSCGADLHTAVGCIRAHRVKPACCRL